MTFEVEIDGRARIVSIEPIGAAGHAGGRFRVVVRGSGDPADVARVVEELDARRTDLGLSLLFVGRPRSLDLAVTERPGGEHLVQFPHVSVTALVDARRGRRGTAGTTGGSSGEQRVTAPMPGRVVRVLVKPGDEVAARQGVVVVEAMKMENELTAARPGRVRDVGVTEGQSVHAGQLLVILE
jgi:biotin carboxyl carrier protein